MVTSLRYIGLSCIVFLGLQLVATGLQCYVCNLCTSPTGLQTVGSGASGYSCTMTTSKSGGVITSVYRGSMLTNSCVESNSIISGTGVIFTCCTTDGCNEGNVLSSSLYLAFALLATAAVFKAVITN